MNQTLVSAIAALLLIAFTSGGRVEAKAPNILFCVADDWGWPHAGAYGDQVIKTPAFDRLAKEGLLFERAFVSSPSCTPCRNSILTGQQFYRLESGANLWSTLDVSYPNFMFLLRDAGYEIGHWRKAWGPGSFEPGGYTEDPGGPASTFDEFLEQRDHDKPFCFWFGAWDPHRPYVKASGAKSGIPVDKVQVPSFYPDIAPKRWPAGAPSGASHLLRNFAECDDGPTKSVLMGMKDDPESSKYYQLSFGERPAVELYDCQQDPDQINNLADEPEHAETVAKLRAQLIEYLRHTKDPRFTDKPVKFETYRYYGRL